MAAPARLRPARLLAPLLGLLVWGGCRSRNPVGFWDIERLAVETPTAEGERVDVGTLEWTSKNSITLVLRYAIQDPATVAGAGGAGDTGDTGDTGDGPAWMPPISPPLVIRTSEEEDDSVRLTIEDGPSGVLAATDISGGTMTLATDEATLGAEQGVAIRLELRR